MSKLGQKVRKYGTKIKNDQSFDQIGKDDNHTKRQPEDINPKKDIDCEKRRWSETPMRTQMRSKKEITPIWFQLISSIESENIKKIFRILMKNNNLFFTFCYFWWWRWSDLILLKREGWFQTLNRKERKSLEKVNQKYSLKTYEYRKLDKGEYIEIDGDNVWDDLNWTTYFLYLHI